MHFTIALFVAAQSIGEDDPVNRMNPRRRRLEEKLVTREPFGLGHGQNCDVFVVQGQAVGTFGRPSGNLRKGQSFGELERALDGFLAVV